MNTSFADYHSAAIFAIQMREEGYFVNILHENAGSLWGGPATGFIVECSDEPIEFDEDLRVSWRISETLTKSIFWVMAFFSILICIAAAIALCSLILHFTLSLFQGEFAYIRQTTTLVLSIVLGCMASVGFLYIIRDEKHKWHRWFVALSIFVSILLCFMIFLTV